MNYREKIREAISCPQFGDDHYGEWGALRLEQRKLIRRLLDELDRADDYIKSLYQENQNLKILKHKAIELTKNLLETENKGYYQILFKEILKSLGDKE